MTKRQRGIVLFILLLLAGITVATDLQWRAQRRQCALDRQLIAALVKENDEQALLLVNAGADPNTPYKPLPAPSLRQMFRYLFYHSPRLSNQSPTAFQIVCGAFWREKAAIFHRDIPDSPYLVKAMIDHGAKPNASSKDPYWSPWTPLMWAIWAHHPKTVSVLLDYGADINVKNQGNRLLDTAVLNALQSYDKRTDEIIPILLAHGAKPDVPADGGPDSIQMAFDYKRHDIVALLRRYGAKK